MSPEDRYQKVNIPIEDDRLVDLLVYESQSQRNRFPYEEERRRRKNMSACVSKNFQEITIDKE